MIHVKTDDASSNAKVALYFPVIGAFPDHGKLSSGTAPPNQPGAQIVFDKDQTSGNSNDDNILVGEQIYSTNPAGQPLTDWYYTGGTAKAAHQGHHLPVDDRRIRFRLPRHPGAVGDCPDHGEGDRRRLLAR